MTISKPLHTIPKRNHIVNTPATIGFAPKSVKLDSQRTRSGQGFVFNHALGQHILKNPLVIKSIIEKSGIRSTDIVLEIGPGTGNLTIKLLEYAKKVIAVEFDARMVCELQKRVNGTPNASKLQIIHSDILKIELPYFDLCIANIPYQISSPLTFKLLSHKFRAAILMYQKEFAQRLVAKPGESLWSRLSLNTQLIAKTSHLISVSRNSFRPPPKVESAVVRIEPYGRKLDINMGEWDGLVRLAFSRKNKTLRAIFTQRNVLNLLLNNYQTVKALSTQCIQMKQDEMNDDNCVTLAEVKAKVEEILKNCNLSDSRASKMNQDDFLKLLAEFNSNSFHFSSNSFIEEVEEMGNSGMDDSES